MILLGKKPRENEKQQKMKLEISNEAKTVPFKISKERGASKHFSFKQTFVVMKIKERMAHREKSKRGVQIPR